ncbi:MAG: hypothetical protein H0V82_13330 [Candidatus Protochlamydia sp.]|nr:hypothetical protein [Candidatus Protochlamydia sp.]
MFDTIQTACNDYYQALPLNSLRAIGRGTIFSFVASATVYNIGGGPLNFERPAKAASVAFVASAVNALTSPFFNWIFANQESKFPQEFIRFVCDVVITDQVINYAMPFKVITKEPGIGVIVHIFSQNMCLKPPLSALCWLIDIVDGRGDDVRGFCQQRLGLNLRNLTPATYITI